MKVKIKKQTKDESSLGCNWFKLLILILIMANGLLKYDVFITY